jgi:c(7)-type cytochrome triheme protein
MKRSALLIAVIGFACIQSPFAAPAKVGGGDIVYKPKGAAPVLFNHEYHVNLKGQRCNSCHYKTFQMTGGAEFKMDMSLLTKGKFCGICHNGKTAFDVKDANTCKRCHKD